MHFPVFWRREICDSENKNGHARLSATRWEGACMQLVGWERGV